MSALTQFSRLFMIFGVLVMLGACSTDDSMMDGQTATGQRDGITAGPLSEIYDENYQGPTPGTQADLVVNVGDRVFFGYDRYDLTPEAQKTLDAQASWLQQYPNLNVTIEGHCVERGTREYNLALGERRANSVANYLTALGVDKTRISTISYGKERPICTDSNEACWSQNRRGVTAINQ